jgi:hypothetical protein
MRTTVDIPDETYKTLKRLAVEEDSTIRQMLLEGVQQVIRLRTSKPPSKRLELPLIPSSGRILEIDSEKIYEIIDFP